MMKRQILRLLLVVSTGLTVGSAEAGHVDGLTSFTAGTTAKASEVNANFSAVSNAVDDNDGRITTNAANTGSNTAAIAGKQDRVTGTCGAGSSIRTVNADGTVVCEVDDNTTYAGASPIFISGTTIGLSAGEVTNTHISPSASIAASKISGDVGIEFNNVFWSNLNIPTTVTSLGSIVVSAPGPGTILLMLNGTAGGSGVNFLHVFGIGTTPGAFNVSRPMTPAGNSNPFSVNWAFPVATPGDYTFHALARKVDPTSCCTATATDVNLIALYVPKRY